MYLPKYQFGAEQQHIGDRSLFDYWKCAAIEMVRAKIEPHFIVPQLMNNSGIFRLISVIAMESSYLVSAIKLKPKNKNFVPGANANTRTAIRASSNSLWSLWFGWYRCWSFTCCFWFVWIRCWINESKTTTKSTPTKKYVKIKSDFCFHSRRN